MGGWMVKGRRCEKRRGEMLHAKAEWVMREKPFFCFGFSVQSISAFAMLQCLFGFLDFLLFSSF